MTTKTYLCSAIVSDIFQNLANAFMAYRDEFDGSQYRNNQHVEDSIMNVILQNHIVSNPRYFPLIRELIGVVLSEPELYAEWTEDDVEFFSGQMSFDFGKNEE
ncbi:hypothetical protein ACFOEW_07580 [Alteromonas oceani]|uniref:Uncharacterized protein n=1 Tax=Alteromonas oceani TaxID=2071609 RepID=A0ABV7JXG5_9ALTE|nr:hypothetical protein [Alteromonas oceani]